ncbi:MAG: VIT1/CCC1 transporter family protein [Streptosporangiaceae bacterium]
MAAPGRPPAETGTAASAASGSGATSVPGPVAQPPGDGGPEINHQHRDVSGGWLRPAVFGAMDGLVTNVSLIAGVGGARLSSHNIILTGLAGLSAGAFSMAAGEFVSVSSQNELVQSEVEKERIELETNPADEQAELAALYKMRGVDSELADEVARQLSRHPEETLSIHVREELGIDRNELPSPLTAAGASLVTFAIGALIPLLPYLLGFSSLAAAVILAAVAAFVGGGIVARVTARPFLRGAVRQLVLAAVAAALTYLIGSLVSGSA